MRNELTSEHDKLDAIIMRCARISFRVVGTISIPLCLFSLWDYALASGANLDAAIMTSMLLVGGPLILVLAERIRT